MSLLFVYLLIGTLVFSGLYYFFVICYAIIRRKNKNNFALNKIMGRKNSAFPAFLTFGHDYQGIRKNDSDVNST